MSEPNDRPKCRRCGKTLQRVYASDYTIEDGIDLFGHPFTHTHQKLVGYGYGATGLFCSLTCGHWFAVATLRGGSGAYENARAPKKT